MTVDNCSVHGLVLNILFRISNCVVLGEVATWMCMTALTLSGLEMDSELTFTARHATSTAVSGPAVGFVNIQKPFSWLSLVATHEIDWSVSILVLLACIWMNVWRTTPNYTNKFNVLSKSSTCIPIFQHNQTCYFHNITQHTKAS